MGCPRTLVGRGNRYALDPAAPLRHLHLAGMTVGRVVGVLDRGSERRKLAGS